MTTVTFFRQGKTLSGVNVSGHAGYAEIGSDIVCSAISVAVHMTALGLSEILQLNVRIESAEGNVQILVSPDDTASAQPMLRTLEREFEEIEKQYPDHISISYTERREFKCFN